MDDAITAHDPFTPGSSLTLAEASNTLRASIKNIEADSPMTPTDVLAALYGGVSEDYAGPFGTAAHIVLTTSGLATDCTTAFDLSSITITGGITWPTPGRGHITSGYGMRTDPVTHLFTRLHAGTDIGAPCGSPIVPVMPGIVSNVEFHGGGLGTYVDVTHAGGEFTRYGHMYPTGIYVHQGQVVDATTVLAAVGSNGNSTGCHLHVELHPVTGGTVDPAGAFGWTAQSHG